MTEREGPALAFFHPPLEPRAVRVRLWWHDESEPAIRSRPGRGDGRYPGRLRQPAEGVPGRRGLRAEPDDRGSRCQRIRKGGIANGHIANVCSGWHAAGGCHHLTDARTGDAGTAGTASANGNPVRNADVDAYGPVSGHTAADRPAVHAAASSTPAGSRGHPPWCRRQVHGRCRRLPLEGDRRIRELGYHADSVPSVRGAELQSSNRRGYPRHRMTPPVPPTVRRT